MDHKEMRQVMQGAVILTVASFIAKVLSALYRIPLQNLVGDEGFYVYQQVYPIYGIAMALALSGLPQFISKYVAEKKEPLKQREALKELYPLVFWTGVCLWLGVWLFSGVLAQMMGDYQLKPLIEVVSFTFLLMPGLSFYRGNFQGHFLMEPTAISQVVEQIVRVSIIVFSAFAFKQYSWDVYETGTAAMSGAVVGGLCAYLVLYYYEQKIHGGAMRFRSFPIFSQPSKWLIRRFLVEGGLVSIYSGLLIFFQLIDSFFVKNALQIYGLSEHASKIAKGVYDRGQPLVQLGLVIATALSATFLPTLTRYLADAVYGQFVKTAKMYLRLTTALALAASVGLAMLLPYINYALFKDYAGNATLVLFVFAIVLTAVIQAYQSIAQSKNSFRPSLKGAGWGLLVKLLTTALFTQWFGTIGASLSTLLGLVVTLWYFIHIETTEVNAFWKERAFGKKLLQSLAWMIFVLFIYYGVIQVIVGPVMHRSGALLISLIGVAIGGLTFVFAVISLKVFTIREWLLLPFGKKILRFNQKFKKK
ncbi:MULTISPECIES: oligosaccharide flippase family protein [Enterococcus]|uniref:Polysaccharide biosynthesis protein n=2 Tax=root TaxID=1 RepID=A0A510WFU9_ENTTH|nr:oligosaccharide flippase family protein [Enterococcus thailandicus]MDA3965372.1 oligosaccharide flippase family protein [Enterococcus thailandicus]OJG94484.1 polysaccharide biosynthesis protein [Enterococcus thailandicus]GEK37431.1 polysaccharide biosynthesis protein [Enterococcus thailandicus]